ncbi:CBS domain-containing protein [Candidatus Woesearchaeota archaeon]|nr:CBS domain-containing protein [Candidatus Woesearchaeota archaeon]
MKTGYKVCDAMTEQPISIPSDTTLEECARIMAQHHVGALVVKGGEGLTGIVTEQDIVRKAVATSLNTSEIAVEEIMERDIETIAPDMDVFDALVKMRDLNIRHLPVVDNNKMVGLLTLKDILKIQPQLFELLVEKFELREAERKPINRISPKEGICQECGNYAEHLKLRKGVMVCGECY